MAAAAAAAARMLVLLAHMPDHMAETRSIPSTGLEEAGTVLDTPAGFLDSSRVASPDATWGAPRG